MRTTFPVLLLFIIGLTCCHRHHGDSNNNGSHARILYVKGTYSGTVNGKPVLGSATGSIVINGKDSNANHIIRTFTHFPDYNVLARNTAARPYYVMQEMADAKNIFSLSGGNFTNVRVCTWSNYPDDSLIMTSTVSTVGDTETFSTVFSGTFGGPWDSVYSVKFGNCFQIVTRGKGIYEEEHQTVTTASGSQEVILKHYYSFDAPFSTEQWFTIDYFRQTVSGNVWETRCHGKVWKRKRNE